jgi:rhodanese-related sulfurtransferase
MMNLIKKYIVVIAVVLPILILVLIRSFGTYHFRSDAVKWAQPSVLRSNIISFDMAVSLPGNKLFVNLVGEIGAILTPGMRSINIPADSILNKKVLHLMNNNDGPVLLYSSDEGVSARVWMILSQLGHSNIYIVSDDPENEVMKNKFRPDTLIRPEL